MRSCRAFVVTVALALGLGAGCRDETILEVVADADGSLGVTSIRVTARINPDRPAVREFVYSGNSVHWLLYPTGDDKDASLEIMAEGLRNGTVVATATIQTRFRRDRHALSYVSLHAPGYSADGGSPCDRPAGCRDAGIADAAVDVVARDAARDSGPADASTNGPSPDAAVLPDLPITRDMALTRDVATMARDLALPPDMTLLPPDMGVDAIDAGRCAAGATECGNLCVDLTSNALNCGACGRSCEGGTCLNGACQPLQLLPATANVGVFVVANGYVYWFTDTAVFRTPTMKGAVEMVAPANDPVSLTAGDGYVFWSQQGDLSTQASGPGVYRIGAVTPGTPVHVSDEVSYTMRVQGGALVLARNDTPLGPDHPFTVFSMDLDGTNKRVLVHEPTPVEALSLNATSAFLEVNDPNGGASALWRIDRASGMAQNLGTYFGLAYLASDATNVYYASQNLGRVPVGGGMAVESPADLGGNVSMILVDGPTLYVTASTFRCKQTTLWKMGTDLITRPEVLVYGDLCIGPIDQDARALYFLAGGVLKRLVK